MRMEGNFLNRTSFPNTRYGGRPGHSVHCGTIVHEQGEAVTKVTFENVFGLTIFPPGSEDTPHCALLIVLWVTVFEAPVQLKLTALPPVTRAKKLYSTSLPFPLRMMPA
jgi:hypothetical protein